MRDDERYPTVVAVPDAPEVTTTPPMDTEGRDKVVNEVPAGLIPVEGQHPVKKDPGDGELRGGDVLPPEKPERRCCGMKRKTFFIVLGVVTVVLIAAIIGGVVGGIKGSSNSDHDGSSSGTGSIKSGPIDSDERSMAASLVVSDDKQNIQVFYNDLDTRNITYQRIRSDNGSGSHTLGLNITPNWGAPLAAAAKYASSKITTNLYYMTTDNDEAQIAEAVLDCGDIDSDDACSVSSNSLISTNLTRGVHDDSKLAALRFGNDSTRVYFQAGASSGSNLSVLINDGGDDWTGSNIVGNVVDGSGIAAAASNKSYLHVFYVSNTTERLAYVDYRDVLGAADPQPVNDSLGATWATTDYISAVHVPKYDSYRIYYSSPAQNKIVSWYSNATSTWKPNSARAWGKPDGSIASVSWSNQVRLLYFEDDQLVMSSQNASIWTKPEDVS